MRAFLFLVIVLQLTLGETTLGINPSQAQDVMLIRRAYIDITSVMPTPTEMEWYIVYCSNNSYSTAVEHLFKKYDTKLIKEYVLSDDYKNQPSRLIPSNQLNKSLLYLAGIMPEETPSSAKVQQAKKILIENSILNSYNTEDAIDQLCNYLMSRSSNLLEINKLVQTFKRVDAAKGEQQAWLAVFEEIMAFKDVCYK